jgi:hypothetical protein
MVALPAPKTGALPYLKTLYGIPASPSIASILQFLLLFLAQRGEMA